MGQQVLFTRPTRRDLIKLVDDAADIIRGGVDYRFILVLLFLKRLSDNYKYELQKKIEEIKKKDPNIPDDIAYKMAKNAMSINFPEEYLWDNIRKDVRKLPENLSKAISELSKLNPDLRGVVDKFDFMEFARNEEYRDVLRRLMDLFSKYDLGGDSDLPDILGDAYEHILFKLYAQNSKAAAEGEFYTPRCVIRLMVNIVDPKPGNEIYDPAVGSGGMLILSYKYVEKKHDKDAAESLMLYGQEHNALTLAICRMNMILHGIRHSFLELGDTLTNPKFTENGQLKKFDIVLANPPWNQKKRYTEDVLRKAPFPERFKFGYPPSSSADWAWIQHMLASTKDDGKVAVVIDQGALFRGGREREIRAKVLRMDWIEGIVLLPPKLFYNTSAQGVVIFFNKAKPAERKNKIIFIDATNEYISHPDVRRLNLLSDENIKKIVDTFREFKDVPGFARVVTLKEIEENDYTLNVPLYVPPLDTGEKIDLAKEWQELQELEKERAEVMKEVEKYVSAILKVSGE